MKTIENSGDSKVHDLVVLSDLHLGEGRLPGEHRFAPTEDFFCDHQFARLLEHLVELAEGDPERLKLVLNGDTFDFLTVVRTPLPEEARERGLVITNAEKKFGLNPSASKSVFKLDVIVAGHPVFFDALARFIARGFEVIMLRGNHDLELHFEEVRERLFEHLCQVDGGPTPSRVRELVRFRQWFYLEPGRAYIEHGNQYESSNSIRYPLRPLLTEKSWWKTDGEQVLDYPLGSIFVRFFYNRVRQLDPYSPRLLSFEQYVDFVRRYNLFDVWRVYRDHYPHFVAALGPKTTTGSSRSTGEEDARQEAAFGELSETDRDGSLYRLLNELKIHPAAASKAAVVKEMVAPLVRRGMWLFLIAFTALFIWFGIFQLIDKVPWLTANAFLMSLFAVLTLGGAAGAWIHLQRKLGSRARRLGASKLEERADKIAEEAGVKMVLMGHTHLVDYRRIRGGDAVYANSGTWTSVNNPWNRIMRDARRMTFLHVRGDEVELKRWNDDAGRLDDVPLFDLEDGLPDNLFAEPFFRGRESGERSSFPSAVLEEDEDEPGQRDSRG